MYGHWFTDYGRNFTMIRLTWTYVLRSELVTILLLMVLLRVCAHTYILTLHTYIHTCIHTYIGPTHTDAYNVLSNTHIFYNILLNHVYFHGVNICTHSRSSMHRCSYICILVCYGHFAKLVSLQNVQTICKKVYFAK